MLQPSPTQRPLDWDVVATDSAGFDVRWFAVQVARELAAGSSGCVRLFADFHDVVSFAGPAAALPAPPASTGEALLYSHRLLSAVRPAKNLMVVFDSVVPRAYTRKALTLGHSHLAFRLLPLWREPASEIDQTDGSGLVLHHLEQGAPAGAFVKPHFDLGTGQTPSVGDKLRHLMSRRDGRRTVLLLPTRSTQLKTWMEAIGTTFVPTTLVIVQPANCERIEDLDFSARAWSLTRLGGHSQLITLPVLNENEMSHCIAQSDLIFTASDAAGLMAASLGRPACYFPDRAGFREELIGSQRFHSMVYGGEAPAIRSAMARLSVAWKYGIQVEESIRDLIDLWGEILQAAQRGQYRYLRSKSICEHAQMLALRSRELGGDADAVTVLPRAPAFEETWPFEGLRP